MRDAVNRLPEKQRSLVCQCDLQGCPIRDVAQAYGIPFTSAQNTRKTARKALFLDRNLRALTTEYELDKTTAWHRHVGVANYRSTWVSSTEALVFLREDRRRMLQK